MQLYIYIIRVNFVHFFKYVFMTLTMHAHAAKDMEKLLGVYEGVIMK